MSGSLYAFRQLIVVATYTQYSTKNHSEVQHWPCLLDLFILFPHKWPGVQIPPKICHQCGFILQSNNREQSPHYSFKSLIYNKKQLISKSLSWLVLIPLPLESLEKENGKKGDRAQHTNHLPILCIPNLPSSKIGPASNRIPRSILFYIVLWMKSGIVKQSTIVAMISPRFG
jgi:hypothetical protein